MLLAHQGGWDELLITLGPVVVIVAILLATSWRAAGDDGDDGDGEAGDGDSETTDTAGGPDRSR